MLASSGVSWNETPGNRPSFRGRFPEILRDSYGLLEWVSGIYKERSGKNWVSSTWAPERSDLQELTGQPNLCHLAQLDFDPGIAKNWAEWVMMQHLCAGTNRHVYAYSIWISTNIIHKHMPHIPKRWRKKKREREREKKKKNFLSIIHFIKHGQPSFTNHPQKHHHFCGCSSPTGNAGKRWASRP